MTEPLVSNLVAAQPGAGFNYEAQTMDGHRLAGQIEAADAEQAMERLTALRLRVIDISPAAPLTSGKAIQGSDFAAFNQQLAQLTSAGMPIEQGLRLIARDMRSGKLAQTIDQLASQLENGTPLDQAFEKLDGKFPPLYGRVIRAGIKSGNLPSVLLNLGQHLEMMQRLRDVLWRAVAYPLFVLIALGFMLSFLGIAVLPEFEKLYAGYGINLPWPTEALLACGKAAPALLFALLLLVIGGPLAWALLRRTGHAEAVLERFVIPIPFVGPVLRFNLVARWCDAARLGVDAGLDLPSAIELANEATRSGRLSRDGAALIDAMSAGKSLTAVEVNFLPASIPAAMHFASGHQDLPKTLASLTDLYQRQAELRLSALPGILTPIFIALLAVLIGLVIIGMLAPLLAIIDKFLNP